MTTTTIYKRISLTIPESVYNTVKNLRGTTIRQGGTFSLSAFLVPHIEAACLERLGGTSDRPPKPVEKPYTLDDFKDSRIEATPPLMAPPDAIHSFLRRLRDHDDLDRYQNIGAAIAEWARAHREADLEHMVSSTVEGPKGPSSDSSGGVPQ